MVLLLIFLLLIITVISLNSNKKITGKTEAKGTKDVEIMVSYKYLSNFGKLLKCH